jgi:hypothetical protein
MFDPNLAVTDGTTPKTYSLQSIVDGKSVRSNAAVPPSTPQILTVSHSKRNPKDLTSADRHLVRFDVTKVDSVSGDSQTLSVYTVIEMPETQFVQADVQDLILRLYHFFSDTTYAGLAKILNNEP